ncbi:helicase-related protein [Spirochaeta cellobiosiphila]|uniref:helicase-related protein n=1 Tax=Spirochaeta cellobiosiphila TaxID=504483 RepID=UPI00040F21C7|nr:ATP-dependent RNA helicase [Spirochaeta cellobiosiphila]
MNPHDLPVYKSRQKILDSLKENQVIIVESPTGSGKTTQLPIILHEAGYTDRGMIGVTQPRRIAALSVSEYIAKQLQTDFPGFVGYKMRFEDKTNRNTHIKILTDGTLLQEIKHDRNLEAYQVLIIDEAHERSLNIDFILGLVKGLLPFRPDLKIIISSATLKTDEFSQYFNKAPVISIDTPTYPVDVIYKPLKERGYFMTIEDKVAEILAELVKNKEEGDVLIFLSGEKIIKDTMQRLYAEPYQKTLHIIPLYGRLGKEAQEKAFEPTPKGKRKVVLATNIAETSITIDGVTIVIDPGMAKINYYNPKTFTSTLMEEPISKASSNQRKGRAGRTQPGKCYRLYTEDQYVKRPLYTREEIYRTDLSEVVLRMAEIGINDFESFDFINPPGRQGIAGAVQVLKMLDALDDHNHLTDIGKMMVDFPLLPRQSRMIVEAIYRYPRVLKQVIIAAAFLSTNSPFLLPQGEEMEARHAHHSFRDPLGDFVSYLHMFNNYKETKDKDKFCENFYLDKKTMDELINISGQLEEIISERSIPIEGGGDYADYLKAIARGNLQFVCIKTGRGIYRSIAAEQIQIHPGSVMFKESPQFLVAGEVVKTSRVFARSVSPLDKSWLKEVLPTITKELITHKITGDIQDNRRGKSKERREDFTDQTRIEGVVVPIKKTKKGHKTLQLHWEQVKAALAKKKIKELSHLRSLRADLYVNGHLIFENMKSMELFAILNQYNPDRAIIDPISKHKTYVIKNKDNTLIRDLWQVLKINPVSKKSRKMGFIGLETDGQGVYWFRVYPKFFTAVDVSLGSIEYLADDLDIQGEHDDLINLNKLYRQLNNFMSL